METNQCRLCGKPQNPFDLINIDEVLKEKIEFHCRLILDNISDRLPNEVCKSCNEIVFSFAEFSENARDTQLKFLLNFQIVKVEVEQLPTIDQYVESEMIDIEPKVKIDEDLAPIANKQEEVDNFGDKDFSDSGSEFDNRNNDSSESDSTYKGNKYYKRKSPKKRGKQDSSETSQAAKPRKKRQKTGSKDEFVIFEDIELSERYKCGTLRKKSLKNYIGALWTDLRLTCVECDQTVGTPVEVHQHNIKYHSAETLFQCTECNESNVEIKPLSFNQLINHYFEQHRDFLKFACVSQLLI
jgi:hypothetical protein